MTAATVTTTIDTADPNTEIVYLEASDGETYVSRKFRLIQGAIAGLNIASASFTDESVSVTWSSQTATIELVGTDTSDVAVTLMLWGIQ